MALYSDYGGNTITALGTAAGMPYIEGGGSARRGEPGYGGSAPPSGSLQLRPMTVLLGIIISLVMFETFAHDWIVGLVILAVLGMLLTNQQTIASQFHQIFHGG